ncbi:hypothetical protein ACT4ML_14040 [Natrinema sp. LN54]
MAKRTATRGLYETTGFEEVSRKTVEAFEEPFDLLVYRKSLSEPAETP